MSRLKIFSIDEVPEQYHRVMAHEGRSQYSLGWISISDECVSLNCCDYTMEFRWKGESIEVVYIGDFNELMMNIFSASILKNDYNDLLKWAYPSPECTQDGYTQDLDTPNAVNKLLLKIRDSLDINIASSILSNLVSDTFAYRSFITKSE